MVAGCPSVRDGSTAGPHHGCGIPTPGLSCFGQCAQHASMQHTQLSNTNKRQGLCHVTWAQLQGRLITTWLHGSQRAWESRSIADTRATCTALLSRRCPRHCLFCIRIPLCTCADADIWDPENDAFLPLAYDHTNVVEGKQAARQALRERLGLTGWGDKPIIGVVTRLTAQKGGPLACACLCTVKGDWVGVSPSRVGSLAEGQPCAQSFLRGCRH